MKRTLLFASLLALAAGCTRGTTKPDSGLDEDAGVDAGTPDAGWPRGTDPATGWSVIQELPSSASTLTRLGVSVASAPDQHGQPLVAYLEDDPNGDGMRQDTRLFFTRWNGSANAWLAPKQVEVVGEIDVAHPNRQVSIARDAVTGRIGIAYVRIMDNCVRFAWSDDDGLNFSIMNASQVPSAALVSNPSLVMAGDTVMLAYVHGSDLVYRKRTGSGDFTEQRFPGSLALQGAVSLALDADGQPGVAFFQSMGGGAAGLFFWRPGAASAHTIATSGTVDVSLTERLPSVTLTFVGTTLGPIPDLRGDVLRSRSASLCIGKDAAALARRVATSTRAHPAPLELRHKACLRGRSAGWYRRTMCAVFIGSETSNRAPSAPWKGPARGG